jgi:hypothetical protein
LTKLSRIIAFLTCMKKINTFSVELLKNLVPRTMNLINLVYQFSKIRGIIFRQMNVPSLKIPIRNNFAVTDSPIVKSPKRGQNQIRPKYRDFKFNLLRLWTSNQNVTVTISPWGYGRNFWFDWTKVSVKETRIFLVFDMYVTLGSKRFVLFLTLETGQQGESMALLIV